MKKILIFIIILLIIIIIGLIGIKFYKIYFNKNNTYDSMYTEDTEEIIVEEKKVEIFNGSTRPIAVMIDNVGSARPQAGLNDAYIVYEIIVEGSQTRLMALFKDVELEKVGPIRSSRHYFLDYALENDAIYVHYGWSPQAKKDISSLKVDNINGMVESAKSFWRVKDKSAPHNAVTSTEKILEIADRKGYRITSEEDSVLNYVTYDVNLNELYSETINVNNEQEEDNYVKNATSITIPYSSSYKVKYEYDEETKKYTRFYNQTTQKDWVTKEIVTTKNIIITFAKNSKLNDGSGKDRQNLSNIGTLKGYYITNGNAIEIECYKESRTSQTIYKDLDGNEINVNDGNTFIQIVPINAKVSIE